MNTEPTPEMIAYAEEQMKELREKLNNANTKLIDACLFGFDRLAELEKLREKVLQLKSQANQEAELANQQLTLWREDAERLAKSFTEVRNFFDLNDIAESESLAAHTALVNETKL